VTGSARLASLLAVEEVSLAFTTYQTSKLFLLGRKPEGRLAVVERTFNRAMGLYADSQTLWLSTRFQVWRFENLLRKGELYQGHGRLYVPKVANTTGDLDIHDIAIDRDGRPVFIATKFGCIATLKVTFPPAEVSGVVVSGPSPARRTHAGHVPPVPSVGSSFPQRSQHLSVAIVTSPLTKNCATCCLRLELSGSGEVMGVR
jgi:hypothetical protein